MVSNAELLTLRSADCEHQSAHRGQRVVLCWLVYGEVLIILDRPP